MKVIIVGNGGREHTLAWKILQSDSVEKVFCIPGNGGTANLPNCQNINLKMNDFDGIAQACHHHQVSLVIVGPELPLSQGIADRLKEKNIPVFGPDKKGAQIEASKSWAKQLMVEAGIPTAASAGFTDKNAAIAYLKSKSAPIVVKADGLAAGKGVIVATTIEEAIKAVENLFENNYCQLLIEEFLEGEEVSILAVTDGITIRPLIPAQDHKRIGEGDTGKNTGGMGAYAPAPIVTPELMKTIETTILQPTLDTLKKRGIDYRGILYAGLMIDKQGKAKVLEFNCRFGDPETQAVLPLLKTPLDELILACVEQRLAQLPTIKWHSQTAICVVAASGGYPDVYAKGLSITGIESAESIGVTVFHAGTDIQNNQLVTSGGRVLGVTAVGENFAKASSLVYEAIQEIKFEGIYYRQDIGHKVKNKA